MMLSQISLTSNLNVLPRFFSASTRYSLGTITMIFSPILDILPVNFIIINHLGIHLYIYYLKYTIVFISILNIVRIQRYTMNTTTQIKQQLANKDIIFHTDFARMFFESNIGKMATWKSMMDLMNLGIRPEAIHKGAQQSLEVTI